MHNAEFGEENAHLLNILSESKPDIIAITGDLVDAQHTDIDTALSFVEKADRIAPVYYVTGNHEASLPQYDELKTGLEAAGVDLVLSGHAHGGQFRLPLIGGLVAPNQGFFPKYDAGLYTDGGTNMVVSRGLGNSIIPLRFNNRPEIVLVELKAD